MAFIDTLIENLPEIRPPTQKKLPFSSKLKWTGIILGLYFLLGLIPLYGLGDNALQQFEFPSTILGASFGSIISLGIGPIVTASIVLQLLNGSGLVNFDLESEEGKRRFQGIQKLLSVFFIVLEGAIFVLMGGLAPQIGISPWVLIAQLAFGGIAIMLMDEIVSKYGFGSGISLFIAAGVSRGLFIGLFSPLTSDLGVPIGSLIAIIFSIFSPNAAGLQGVLLDSTTRVLSTVAIFFAVVYLQSMKVEIPLSFGRIKGHGVRWPLNFLYANVIPIILVSALIANIRLFAGMLGANNTSLTWLSGQNVIKQILIGALTWSMVWHSLLYMLIYAVGAMIFSIFWVQTSGLDASSQATQMVNSGLQIPGFRRDKRVLERLLKRYITPLTVMGGITIGLLAGFANLTGAIGSGTGLLLTVMIIYKLYEDIAKEHMYDMNPAMRKFIS